ncbi:uncharacterized protein LOC123667707 [Melitaea cinxia]|uniref:uncharacterized protein LOC123667707 n=1 Tax=Melitaea cinxia TaxID=113334 RepID=UPI001E27321B|nr:uncharacterized protein LOC123667707 [Melitaea cinxia]
MIDTNGNRAAQPSKSAAKSKSFHASLEKEKEKKSKAKQECPMCHEIHYLNQCKRFSLMTPKQRQDFVQTSKLCFNYLAPTHAVVKCRQSFSCKKCGRRHHTMLHFERENQEPASNLEQAAAVSSSEPQQERANTTRGDTHITTAFSRGELQPDCVLLATAKVKVFHSNGFKYIIRALLDQGSQASFVSESTVQLLGLVRKPVSGWVSGLGNGRMKIKNTVTLRLESRYNTTSYILVNAYVLHSLTSLLPSTNVSLVSKWLEIDKLPLADPTYSTPGKIDILLGAEVYSEILLDGVMKHPACNLIAQNTVFGWILSGRMSKGDRTLAKDNLISRHIHMKEDELLKRFWEMENEPNLIKKEMTNSEKVCEDLFDSTTVRDDEGRFIVRLPFATDDPKCQYGKTEVRAVNRLERLERKLSKDLKLREEYNKVMSEYLSMNHMRMVSESELQKSKAVYLPHHAVVSEDKDTTKVRVVFDASSKGDNGVSLNDELLVGPRLQQDLRHILMRWRHHKICIVADIVKMYRMVRVAGKDTDFQRIVWRFDPSEPIQPVKVLHRLAELEQKRYPLAAAITKQGYYMDDLMTGSDTVSEAIKIYEEMNELMRSAGFELQKWNSNNERFLEQIGKIETSERQIIKLNDLIKVLGLSWNRKNDNFEYVVDLPEPKDLVTKRQVLSEVARLYDPLGWISPVVVNAKILIQKLWSGCVEWDESLTDELHDEWLKYRQELVDLKNLKIPRWLNFTQECKRELHVFSDSSKTAFAAAVYTRVIDRSNRVYVHLLAAKTRVAPIVKEISIPRLELCGATLAAKLICEVSQVLDIPKKHLYGWTDSTIVLAWLQGGSSRWATFVSNRVSTILNIMDYQQWSHVSSETNPADCASRGLSPKDLREHTLWWRGPQWLSEATVKTESIQVDTHEEERIKSLTVLSNIEENFIWSKYSSLNKLLKIVSYCRRVLNYKLKKDNRPKLPKYITSSEMNETLLGCIKQVQEREFLFEIKQLNTEGCVPKKSKLRSLCPFLDQKGILRVSGRIAQSDACYDMKHPIIMPGKHHFTKVLIADGHAKTLHGGPQAMLNLIRTKYWILRAKERVKNILENALFV